MPAELSRSGRGFRDSQLQRVLVHDLVAGRRSAEIREGRLDRGDLVPPARAPRLLPSRRSGRT